ncbi:hypothetical protein F4777DRAFT_576967 [Nemania sp. FL0916]|nr:hypothetical protein F4777DRAFT_576967 [Nemania sp. FL0916]
MYAAGMITTEAHPGLEANPASRILSDTDEQIVASLSTHVPVTSERNVWMFWDGGFAAMPAWIQRSVVNTVRREGKHWTVRLLDLVPGSSNHVLCFTDRADFPRAALMEGSPRAGMKGMDAGQHLSDFARLAVVYRHGGIYLDAGILLLRDLDDVCWSALADPESPYTVACMAQQMSEHPGQVLNSFIAGRAHDPFIYRWQQVFLKMWEGRDTAVGLHAHPLVAHLPLLQIATPSIPAGADWASFTDYVAQIQAFERVRLNREPPSSSPHANGTGDAGVGFDGPAYFRKHFYLLDARTEMFLGQAFDGAARVLQLLLLPRRPLHGDDDEEDQDQAEASRFVHDVLSRSSCCKFSSGTGRLGLRMLVARQWGLPEHADDDCRPGTWGEYLRYGSVYLRQTREVVLMVLPEEEKARITRVGLLEPALT